MEVAYLFSFGDVFREEINKSILEEKHDEEEHDEEEISLRVSRQIVSKNLEAQGFILSLSDELFFTNEMPMKYLPSVEFHRVHPVAAGIEEPRQVIIAKHEENKAFLYYDKELKILSPTVESLVAMYNRVCVYVLGTKVVKKTFYTEIPHTFGAEVPSLLLKNGFVVKETKIVQNGNYIKNLLVNDDFYIQSVNEEFNDDDLMVKYIEMLLFPVFTEFEGQNNEYSVNFYWKGECFVDARNDKLYINCSSIEKLKATVKDILANVLNTKRVVTQEEKSSLFRNFALLTGKEVLSFSIKERPLVMKDLISYQTIFKDHCIGHYHSGKKIVIFMSKDGSFWYDSINDSFGCIDQNSNSNCIVLCTKGKEGKYILHDVIYMEEISRSSPFVERLAIFKSVCSTDQIVFPSVYGIDSPDDIEYIREIKESSGVLGTEGVRFIHNHGHPLSEEVIFKFSQQEIIIQCNDGKIFGDNGVQFPGTDEFPIEILNVPSKKGVYRLSPPGVFTPVPNETEISSNLSLYWDSLFQGITIDTILSRNLESLKYYLRETKLKILQEECIKFSKDENRKPRVAFSGKPWKNHLLLPFVEKLMGTSDMTEEPDIISSILWKSSENLYGDKLHVDINVDFTKPIPDRYKTYKGIKVLGLEIDRREEELFPSPLPSSPIRGEGADILGFLALFTFTDKVVLEPPLKLHVVLSQKNFRTREEKIFDKEGKDVKVTVIDTIGDGNCMMHSIVTLLSEKYRVSDSFNKQAYVSRIRNEIALHCLSLVNGKTNFENFNIRKYDMDTNPYKLAEFMCRVPEFLGDDICNYICKLFNVGIIVDGGIYTDQEYDEKTKRTITRSITDIKFYPSFVVTLPNGKTQTTVENYPRYIIIRHRGAHYEPICRQEGKMCRLIFPADHMFINAIRPSMIFGSPIKYT